MKKHYVRVMKARYENEVKRKAGRNERRPTLSKFHSFVKSGVYKYRGSQQLGTYANPHNSAN